MSVASRTVGACVALALLLPAAASAQGFSAAASVSAVTTSVASQDMRPADAATDLRRGDVPGPVAATGSLRRAVGSVTEHSPR